MSHLFTFFIFNISIFSISSLIQLARFGLHITLRYLLVISLSRLSMSCHLKNKKKTISNVLSSSALKWPIIRRFFTLSNKLSFFLKYLFIYFFVCRHLIILSNIDIMNFILRYMVFLWDEDIEITHTHMWMTFFLIQNDIRHSFYIYFSSRSHSK